MTADVIYLNIFALQEVVDEVTGTMSAVVKRLTVVLADKNLEEIASVMTIFWEAFSAEDRFCMVEMGRGEVYNGPHTSAVCVHYWPASGLRIHGSRYERDN